MVDSASPTPDVVLTAVAAGARVLRAGTAGASVARNLGWQAATRPIVAFTDDDCRPLPSWLDRMAATFDRPEVGFVYGGVSADGAGPPLSVTAAGDATDLPAGEVRTIDRFGHGANVAVRRSALAAVGGWEPRLGAGRALAGGEDTDLALRLLRAGWAGRVEPAAAVTHLAWRGRGAAVRTTFGYGLGAGAVATRARRADGDWWLLRHELGDRGIRQVWRDARAGYELGVAAGAARVAGVAVGALRALTGAA